LSHLGAFSEWIWSDQLNPVIPYDNLVVMTVCTGGCLRCIVEVIFESRPWWKLGFFHVGWYVGRLIKGSNCWPRCWSDKPLRFYSFLVSLVHIGLCEFMCIRHVVDRTAVADCSAASHNARGNSWNVACSAATFTQCVFNRMPYTDRVAVASSGQRKSRSYRRPTHCTLPSRNKGEMWSVILYESGSWNTPTLHSDQSLCSVKNPCTSSGLIKINASLSLSAIRQSTWAWGSSMPTQTQTSI
jgi:hypothetical protein